MPTMLIKAAIPDSITSKNKRVAAVSAISKPKPNLFVDIDQTVRQIFYIGFITITQLGHGARFKTAIVVDGRIRILIDFFQKLLPDLGFVIRVSAQKG